jgi:hypothetical protein
MLEYNDFDNASRAHEVRQAVQAQGDVFCIWMRRDGSPDFTPANARQACVESQAQGFAAEAEIPSVMIVDDQVVPNPQATNWVELIFQLQDLPISKGLLTNFAPFITYVKENGQWVSRPWPEKAKPLIDAGWRCMPEAYDMPGGDPSTWPGRRAFYASHLGWDVTQPGLGLYGPPNAASSLDDYPTRHEYPNWWVWSAENILR